MNETAQRLHRKAQGGTGLYPLHGGNPGNRQTVQGGQQNVRQSAGSAALSVVDDETGVDVLRVATWLYVALAVVYFGGHILVAIIEGRL